MDIGTVRLVNIEEEMRGAYLDYAMSVITSRALPDVRDGLKPVQRRILYSMDELGLRHTAPYKKSARIVGECFVAGTRVLTERGLLPIERVERGDRVFTQNGQVPVSELYEMPERPLLRITLENGLALTATPSQRLKVLTRKLTYAWKEASALGPDDYVVLRASYPSALPYVRLPDWQGQPVSLDENLAYVLGQFLSDGWFERENGRFCFYSTSPAIIRRVEAALQATFGYAAQVEALRYRVKLASGSEREGLAYQIRINARALNEYLATAFDISAASKAGTKRVPEQIFQSPRSVIAALLSGLVDGDGSVHATRNVIEYSTISAGLADDLQLLLLHLGVLTRRFAVTESPRPHVVNGRLVASRQPSVSVEATGRHAQLLADLLDLAHETKAVAARRLPGGRRKVTAYDRIPYAGAAVFGELSRRHLGAGWYQDASGEKFRSGIRYPGGAKIRYAAGLADGFLGRTQIADWGIASKLERLGSDLTPFCAEALTHDSYFLRVAEVASAPAERTYDLQVAGPHEFIANGVVAHNCLGKYHPHGDAPVYEAMARLAQDFSMRYPLVDGQGNFGSVDGDPPAAMRYTEARLTALAEELLADIDKNTVDFYPNFDESLTQPTVLPAKLPNLLVNGSAGIAVGMATNIPPHNLTEVVDAAIFIIDHYDSCIGKGVPFELVWGRAMGLTIDDAGLAQALERVPKKLLAEIRAGAAKDGKPAPSDAAGLGAALLDYVNTMIDITPDQLMAFVRGPDFPTAGVVHGLEGIKQAYTTGHGRIVVGSKVEIDEVRGGRYHLVVRELPYQVNKATLVERIAELARERKIPGIDGISDLRDESDRDGMRIVIELKRDARPQQVLAILNKHTAMRTAFSVNMLALVDGQPRVLTLKMALLQYLNYRKTVLTRRTQFELDKARQRAHILEGLKIALDNLDAVIQTIRQAKDTPAARAALIANFKLTEIQAEAILDMQLRRLAALERQKLLQELKDVQALIAKLEDLLAHPVKILHLVRDDLTEMKTKYGDARRTQIVNSEAVDLTLDELIPQQEVAIIVTRRDYVKRLPSETYRLRGRGGKGAMSTVTREDDGVQHLLVRSTHDDILFFTNRGRVFQTKAHELPDAGRSARGMPLINFIKIVPEETVTAALGVSDFARDGYLVLATRKGEVKRVRLDEFAAVRSSGLIAMQLEADDELVAVRCTNGKQDVLLLSRQGQSIRFKEDEIRASSRNSGGIRGIRLEADDRVIAAEVSEPDAELLLVSELGFAKRTDLSEFPTQGRGGGGVRAIGVTARSGPLATARLVRPSDEVLVISAEGLVLRTTVEGISKLGRAARGVILMNLDGGDRVAAVAVLGSGDDRGTGNGANGKGRSNGHRPGTNGADAAAQLSLLPEKPSRRRDGENGKSD